MRDGVENIPRTKRNAKNKSGALTPQRSRGWPEQTRHDGQARCASAKIAHATPIRVRAKSSLRPRQKWRLTRSRRRWIPGSSAAAKPADPNPKGSGKSRKTTIAERKRPSAGQYGNEATVTVVAGSRVKKNRRPGAGLRVRKVQGPDATGGGQRVKRRGTLCNSA